MHPVVSTNVVAVGYDATTRTMRVQFGSGTYEYSNVDDSLYQSMLLPHPWRRVGRQVKAHPYRKIG